MDLNDVFPANTASTEIIFACGKKMILHSDHPMTEQEIKTITQYTAEEFKGILMATGRFKQIPIGNA